MAQKKIEGTLAAITEITPKEGYEKDILNAVKTIQAEASKEPGCLLFSLSTKKDAHNTVVLFEIFKDEAALVSHKEQQHTKDFGKQLQGKCQDNKVTFLNTVSTLHK
ncbi:putative quinol monooxygenase [Pustulibacterium marinum]|nr:antibiotic biosynthesis monooxygenase family protein [Pustulibacterium marinum]